MKLMELASKSYFIVDVEYGQTDKSTLIVQAESKDDAVEKVRKVVGARGAKYISVIRSNATVFK